MNNLYYHVCALCHIDDQQQQQFCLVVPYDKFPQSQYVCVCVCWREVICVFSISLLYLFWQSVLLSGWALHFSDKRAVMSTLGAVKEPPGRVDILQH